MEVEVFSNQFQTKKTSKETSAIDTGGSGGGTTSCDYFDRGVIRIISLSVNLWA